MSQLELPLDGWVLKPTPAMLAGDQRVWQCAWCGTVVIVASPSPASADPAARDLRGRACPACDHPRREWWRQDTPTGDSLAGFTFVGAVS
jgi:hypothetical protein